MRVHRAWLAAIFLATLGNSQASASDEAVVVHLRDGETKSVYWQINLTGVVFLSIRSAAGAGCARMFWRTFPLNRTVSLEEICGNVRLEIPGIRNGAIMSTLWARANQGEVKIVGSSSERVAYDFPPVSFP